MRRPVPFSIPFATLQLLLFCPSDSILSLFTRHRSHLRKVVIKNSPTLTHHGLKILKEHNILHLTGTAKLKTPLFLFFWFLINKRANGTLCFGSLATVRSRGGPELVIEK